MLRGRDEAVRIIALDKLTYAGNLANISDLIDGKRLIFVLGDICDRRLMDELWKRHEVRQVVHFAAESHVDRSLLDSGPFLQTNVIGTQVLLDVARANNVEKFVQVSTDEVYGSLPEDKPQIKFTEETPLSPNSPYSASKASADCLVRAYHHTFGFPAMITRCSNNYGPYQFPEKVMPLFVTNLIEGKKVPLYGDGMNVRDWIYVEDHCEAVWTVLNKGRAGEVYNIGGNSEVTNKRLTETILRLMGKKWDESVTYVKDRPGHDRRYAIDAGKMERELAWKPKYVFERAIAETIEWYQKNEKWWRAIKTGEYVKYYEAMYAKRA
jgi:dTDP-glucose 4,6-dehydratase